MSNQNEEIVQVLTDEECWQLLGDNALGRLAFAVAGVPEIVPVNYHAADGKLYFRTAEGSKLLGVTINQEVAFEIDQVDGREARSVVVQGAAREITSEEERSEVEKLPLVPWVPTDKFHYVEIVPDQITGRRFQLGPVENA